MRILHLLHRSVPGTHGYAIRSREIVTKQLAQGLEPLVITSPSQAPLGPLDSEQSETIDGVRYFRTGTGFLAPTKEVDDRSQVRSAMRIFQNLALLKKAARIAEIYRPAVIHGHSPFTCGLIANRVGRRMGIPAVYEMRGIWEDTHTARYGMGERTLRYRTIRWLENLALNGADLCCVICEALRNEVQSRGVPAEKIVVVPNGADVRSFVPGPPDEELQQSMGLNGKVVAGYIGSFNNYEGLDLLVQAVDGLTGQIPNLHLLLVGDGEMMPTLRTMAQQGAAGEKIIFTGSIPHKDVAKMYRLCDLLVLPRRDTRLTRLVTPLKPLEVMAMAKPLLASDIEGHREMVLEGENGLLFDSEKPESLQARMVELLQNETLRIQLGLQARRWVELNRDWNILAERYTTIYQRLVQR